MNKNKRVKRWGFLISLFMLFLVSPLRVNAVEVLTLVGDSSVSPGATVKYNVVVTPTDATTLITDFSTTVTYDSSVLTLSQIELGTGWSGPTTAVTSGKTINFSNEAGVSTTTTVATLVFKVNKTASSNTATITLKSSYYNFKDVDGETMVQINDVTKSLNIKSSDNSLKSLKVNGVIVEGFSSDIFEYEVLVESSVEEAKILATTNSTKATLKTGSGNRTVPLNYGGNVVIVTVVSESGLEQNYVINITREDTRSTDTTLKSITIDGVKIDNFKSSTYKYNVKKYKTSGVTIVAVPNDEKATVAVLAPLQIVVGENVYTVRVTSENGDTSDYTVVVNNIDTPINKKLKNLSIPGYKLAFDKNNNRYEIRYNKEKFKDLKIHFTTVSGNDEVKAVLSPDINNNREALKNLKPGDEITITITGIDDESVQYTIVILEDNRINFFLILEIFMMVVIAVCAVVVAKKRKNNKSKKAKKSTSVKKEVTTKKEVNSKKEVSTKTEKPKKKRFSIFEDEYEEVEVEVDDNDLDIDTKELSTKDLKLK